MSTQNNCIPSIRTSLVILILQVWIYSINIELCGTLWLVGWVANSWFWLRLWFQVHWIDHNVCGCCYCCFVLPHPHLALCPTSADSLDSINFWIRSQKTYLENTHFVLAILSFLPFSNTWLWMPTNDLSSLSETFAS